MSPRLASLTIATLGLATLAACGDTASTLRPPPNLDRPVDIAFGCYGGLRLAADPANPTTEDPIVQSAQPLESCRIRSQYVVDPDPEDGVPPEQPRPPGQEELGTDAPQVGAIEYYGFVLQSVPGTVALLRWPTKAAANLSTIDVTFADADPLTPGRNSIPVGTLPVALATDPAGCYLMTANAGSCDLSVVEIGSIVDGADDTPANIRRVQVTNAAGEPIAAKPAAMVSQPDEADEAIGVECGADPTGVVYVAYPDCHLVAAVDAASGEIVAGVQFAADGTIALTDGNVSCPAQCGGGGALTPGPHPTTIDLVHDRRVDTRRLVIGAEDSPTMAMVELDAGYLPLSVSPVPLSGDVGVLDVALSPQIGMGGTTGGFDDEGTSGGQHQFVYAVTSDQTVRVADVLGTATECDTQVDPRFLRLENNIGRLACMPVGDPLTPPRRALARGPGIELVAGSVPLSVAIAPAHQLADVDPDAPRPETLQGYFAFITATTGETVIVNIDDDVYRDTWQATDPLSSQLALGAAHQIRDAIVNRAAAAVATVDEVTQVVCNDEGADGEGSPRTQNASLTLGYDDGEVNQQKRYVLPTVQRVLCEGRNGPLSISELSYQRSHEERDLTFPDLRAIRAAETWFLTWEGSLSRDEVDENIDGSAVRAGLIARDGGAMTVRDPSRPFCEAGAQPGDLIILTGCDPSQGDGQCGLDETCYVHPDSQVPTGMCLKEDVAEQLGGICRDLLVTSRKYAVRTATAGEVRVVPRRHMLTTTPVDGCVSDQQCMDLAQYEASLASGAHPESDDTVAPDRAYRCEADVTRQGDLPRCMQVCETSEQCDAGTVCSGGYCIEGVLPPPECVGGLQRYTVHAGDAITVVGDLSGYLHNIVEDEATGACVPDPTASPLLTGRIPLSAPPCPGPDGYDQLTPNPCSTTVVQTEPTPTYAAGTCDLEDAETLVTRDAPAIRFKNPMFTFHLVDPWYPGDAVCREDRAGTLGMIPTVHPGYQYTFPIVSGFFTARASTPSVLPVRAVKGPEDSIWVIDEGDDVPDELDGITSTRGQVFRFEPTVVQTVNVVQ